MDTILHYDVTKPRKPAASAALVAIKALTPGQIITIDRFGSRTPMKDFIAQLRRRLKRKDLRYAPARGESASQFEVWLGKKPTRHCTSEESIR